MRDKHPTRYRRHKPTRPIGAFVVIGLMALTVVYRAFSSHFAPVFPARGAMFSDGKPHGKAAHAFEFPGLAQRVYAFSVIPGGVRDADELARALQSDEIAARHYHDFRLADVHMVASAMPRPVYVSYRMGDQVYWTRHRVRLIKGERLLTDGVSYARARCGNRISETPQQPTAEDEPPVSMFDVPVPAGLEPSPPPQHLAEGPASIWRTSVIPSPASGMLSSLPIEASHARPDIVIPEPGSASLVLFAIPLAAALWLRRR